MSTEGIVGVAQDPGHMETEGVAGVAQAKAEVLWEEHVKPRRPVLCLFGLSYPGV